MVLSKSIKSLLLAFAFCIMVSSPVFAAPGDVQQIKYIYFENASAEIVVVDYMQAIASAIHGDSTLYNSLKTNLGIAISLGKPIVLETTIGTVLDYQQALIQNKPNLIDFQADVSFQISKPISTQELKIVNGVAVTVPVIIPSAPSVTNDDALNTVTGMATGMEYNLDGVGYVAYNQPTFDAINLAGIHTLLVRVAAGTHPAGDVTTLNFTTNPVIPAAPGVTNDDTLNIVTGMAAGMEYNLDGLGYVAYEQPTFDAINFAGNHTLLVRVAALAINPAGADQVLTFTASSLTEAAESAVAAYEAAPIRTLAEVVIAEGFKPAAELAVTAVTDVIQKSVFENRIIARTSAVSSAKAALQAIEASAQATAATAVGAYEVTTLSNIAQINNADWLRMQAEQAVGAVGEVTVKADLTARIVARTAVVTVAEINLREPLGMDSAIRLRSEVLGLDLTEYNALGNKVPVQTTLLGPTFTTVAEIKTAFDAAVQIQKTLETTVLAAFNNALNGADISVAIATHASALSLGLTEYGALTSPKKDLVHAELLPPVFTSGEDIKIAFIIAVMNNTNDTNAMTLLTSNAELFGLSASYQYSGINIAALRPIADKTQIVVAAFNNAVLQGYMNTLITINYTLLGLDLTDYNALMFRNRMKAQTALINSPMTNKAEVQVAFNTAVSTQKAFETSGVSAFNNAADATAMGAAITTYVNPEDLGNYPNLANKVPVQTALLTPIFSLFSEVQAAFDVAVAAQKAIETVAITAINTASAATMDSVITTNAITLGLDLTDYTVLANKVPVHTALIAKSYVWVFDIKTAFNAAVAIQKAVGAINVADVTTMPAVITSNATTLGLTLNDYNVLGNPVPVHTALVNQAFADKAAVNTAFETAVSIPTINAVLTEAGMGTAIVRYAPVLGLDLTIYYGLYAPYNATVQTALIGKAFTTATEVQTVFDTAVALAKVAKAIAAINNATTAGTMHTAITTNATTLGLVLADYNVLGNKVPVQTAMLGRSFTTVSELKAAFDIAVALQEVNAATVNQIGAIIVKDAVTLGLVLTDYMALINKESVYAALESPLFATIVEVQSAFDGAVANQKAIEAPILGSAGVKLNKATTSLATGSTETLTATVLPTSEPNKAVTWASSDEAIATVDSAGNVTGVSAGTVTITVTALVGSYADTCTVTVVVSVTGVTLNRTTSYMLIGQDETLLATVSPADATNKNLTWASSSLRATVDNTGKVTGVAVGMATTITASTADGNLIASCQIIVTTESNAISQTTQLSLDYMATNIVDYSTALGLNLADYNALPGDGQSEVQAALFKKTFATAAALKAAFDAAVLAATPVLVPLNAPLLLAAPAPAPMDAPLLLAAPTPVTPDAPLVTNNDLTNVVDGMDLGMEYKLDNAEYIAYDSITFALLDFSGDHILLVRVAAEGINPKSADTNLTFTTNPAATTAVTAVILDQVTLTLSSLGDVGTLVAKVDPVYATNQLVTWSSSDPLVATVNDGVVTPLATGVTTIRVTTVDGGHTATCYVTVI